MYGRILTGGGRSYTFLSPLFAAIRQAQKRYNWLITDFEGGFPLKERSRVNSLNLRERYAWLTGEELTRLAEQMDFPWSWGVFSGFDQGVALDQVLEYELPYADGNPGFWKNPVSVQHPLAALELTAWDNACALVISRDEAVLRDFAAAFPDSIDLERHNEMGREADQSQAYEAWLRNAGNGRQ